MSKEEKSLLWRNNIELEIQSLDVKIRGKIKEKKKCQFAINGFIITKNKLIAELNKSKSAGDVPYINVVETETEEVDEVIEEVPVQTEILVEESSLVVTPLVLTDLIIATKLVQLSKSAASRNLDFNLDFKTVKKLLTAKLCYFTREELEPAHLLSPKSRTIDRLDNSQGYVIGNVVPCSKWFNEVKANLTIDQFLLLQKGFKKAKLI